MLCFSEVGKIILFVVAVNSALLLRNSSKLEMRFSGKCGMKSFYFDVATEVQLHRTIKDELGLMKQSLNIIIGFQKELKCLAPDKANKTSYLENLSTSFALACRISNKWPPILSLMKMTFGKFMKNLEIASFTTFTTNRANYWKALESYMSKDKATEYFYHPINTSALWKSAIIGLVRLQETYNLSSTDLASGGAPAPTSAFNHTGLSARDCYDIGFYCMHAGVPFRAVEWLLEASRRAVEDPGVHVKKLEEYLLVAFCYIGDTRSYRILLRKLFEDTEFSLNKELHKEYADLSCMNCKQLMRKHLDLGYYYKNVKYRANALHVANQRGLCRKETVRPPRDKKLKCRMIHYKQPYLRIGPLRMEELNIEPPVLLFHEVVPESEINELLEESYNQTKPAILDYWEGYDEYLDTQLNRWLYDEATEVAKKWDIKSATITNAGLYRSENLMVGSYGLGGEIRLHMDLGSDEGIMDETYSRGDYITLMYWLKEPLEGGFTIIPKLNLAVPPKEGSAILWFNRYPDWKSDGRLRHSGCPIIRGTKWVVTKWFHVLGQQFPKCLPGKQDTRAYYYLESNIMD